MLCYKLESDEVALFESDVSLKENKDKNVILITNHNIVIETTKKYSLQGTTQGNGLTGGVPPVRFSM